MKWTVALYDNGTMCKNPCKSATSRNERFRGLFQYISHVATQREQGNTRNITASSLIFGSVASLPPFASLQGGVYRAACGRPVVPPRPACGRPGRDSVPSSAAGVRPSLPLVGSAAMPAQPPQAARGLRPCSPSPRPCGPEKGGEAASQCMWVARSRGGEAAPNPDAAKPRQRIGWPLLDTRSSTAAKPHGRMGHGHPELSVLLHMPPT